MKKVWKWIIGIVIALIVIAALVVGGFFIWMHAGNYAGVARVVRPGTTMPGFGREPFNNTWGGHGYIMRGPGMMEFGRTGIFGGLFGGLIGIGLLALIIMGIIWLARSLRTPATAKATASEASVAAAASEVEESNLEASAQTCPKCGSPVQTDWKHCANCGRKL